MAAGDVITIIEDAKGRKGVYFDGNDDYILVDAHVVERVAANDTVGTYTAWVFPDNFAAEQCILSAGANASATEYFKLTLGATTGILRSRLNFGGAAQFIVDQTTASIPLRKWTHIAFVQNGTQPALYVNGVAVAATNTTATDLTYWYDELTGCDKFAIGVQETNATHVQDFTGAIGQVKYWSRALSAAEIFTDYNDGSVSTTDNPDSTYLRLNLTMDFNGTTDSGAGADNGTLTGNAHYGGVISPWSYEVERNSSGHAAEFINTFPVGQGTWCSVIKRGD